jgi:ABC-type antimicrobial peptide transport system permease subunit
MSASAFGGTLLVRSTRETGALTADLRGAIRSAMPDYVIPDTQTMESLFDRLVNQRKLNMIVLALFGVLAVTIAAVGIYGVMSYIVQQRTQEIGVRLALGAQPGQLVRSVLVRAGVFMGMGLAVGLVGGWLLARLVQSFLFRCNRMIRRLRRGRGILMVAGLVAALVPAHRASRVDPLIALR